MNKTVFFKTFRRLFGFVLAISLSASVLTAQAQNARITLNLSDGRTIYQKQGKMTEAKIDTQPYSGEVFILSVQIESGKYYHLKLGRVN